VAKEGFQFISPAIMATGLFVGLWFMYDNWLLLLIGILAGILTVFFLYFFRDPERTIPAGEGLLVAPADGYISTIKDLSFHPFFNSAASQVSIFLSVFDVHINRVPLAGTVEYVTYKRGKFLAAYKSHASEENEQSEIGLTSTNGTKVVFKQIAGALARRIICRLKQGQEVIKGERFGMIKFGSRTDLIVPANTRIEVKLGQHVKGGSTIIGRIPDLLNSKTISANSSQANA